MPGSAGQHLGKPSPIARSEELAILVVRSDGDVATEKGGYFAVLLDFGCSLAVAMS